MSAEISTEAAPVVHPAGEAEHGRHLVWTIAKNVMALAVLLGCVAAYQTGYFSNDRISRAEWSALESFAPDHKGRTVYDAKFTPGLLQRRDDPAGVWDLYNNARAETVTTDGSVLNMKYSLAWLGVYFRHTAFEPKVLYRVRFEAKVDGQPAAILMRNRQLDFMREQLPVTGGTYREFTADYAAPAGSFDHVRIIFMPDGRGKVSGELTLRKFTIERLEK